MMIPNPIDILASFFQSLLAPIPSFARSYVVVGTVVGILYILGFLSDGDSDGTIEQMSEGIGVAANGVERAVGFTAPKLVSGAIIGGGALLRTVDTIGTGVWKTGGKLVEFEEAPIQIGPLVEVYGIRVGLIGLILGLLGLGASGLLNRLPLP